MSILSTKDDAAAAEQVIDHADGELKADIDYFLDALKELARTHKITITVEEKS